MHPLLTFLLILILVALVVALAMVIEIRKQKAWLKFLREQQAIREAQLHTLRGDRT